MCVYIYSVFLFAVTGVSIAIGQLFYAGGVNFFLSTFIKVSGGFGMDKESADSSPSPPVKAPEVQPPAATDSGSDNSPRSAPSKLSSWAKSLKIPQPVVGAQDVSPNENAGKSSFSRFTSGLGFRLSPKSPSPAEASDGTSTETQPGFLGTITKGLVDSSKNAVKAVQVKARHVVSQNKRRYQVRY